MFGYRSTFTSLFVLSIFVALPCLSYAQIDARLMRYPDVSQEKITFVYAGDIWVVDKEGGVAHRLSSPKGTEEFPRFSPDGKHIAYSANYHGNTEIYTISTMGGKPERLTYHPRADRMLNWYPDGQSILFASSMKSGRKRYNQLYRLDRNGGLPSRLPVPYGEFGTISPDGTMLAYMPKSRVYRNWKRYRGGWASDIWIFNLSDSSSVNITSSPANDAHPMWHNQTLYFLSDRGPHKNYNIWAYHRKTQQLRQITQFEEFDVSFPEIGPSEMVFHANGEIYLLDLETEEYNKVNIELVTDQSNLQRHIKEVEHLIQNFSISPHGSRAAFEARGEIFSVPKQNGPVRNLTNTPGIAERNPAWSPDGQKVAYWSDRDSEYELFLRGNGGLGTELKVSDFGPGYRYNLFWGPNSERVAFINKAMEIKLYNTQSRKSTQVDSGLWMYHNDLRRFNIDWSPNGRWITYSRGLENRHDAIFLYDTQQDTLYQATSGYYRDRSPRFGPDGKYLYLLTSRNFEPSYSDVDNTWIYANTTHLAAIPLRKDVKSPLAPRNDSLRFNAVSETSPEKENMKSISSETQATPVKIDIASFEDRMVILPTEAGNYANPQAVEGKLLYRQLPRTGSGEKNSPLKYYDLEDREEKTIIGEVDHYQVSADDQRILVMNNSDYKIIDVATDQEMDDPMPTDQMEMVIDPQKEWHQLFMDVWRFERDYFYDPNMHGVDWEQIRERYKSLIEDASTRWDVNHVIGDMIAELNASHTYNSGGDVEETKSRQIGLLGVDWNINNGYYQIEEIIRGASWDVQTRSPLDRPGLNVKKGDYVFSVNGMKLDTADAPWDPFDGLAGKTVELEVGSQPDPRKAKTILVKTLQSEAKLRYLHWLETKRQRVEKATNGRVGYVYVRSTGIDGQNELVRQFNAQFNKEALIIDERFNSGGQIPDRFIELLQREILSFWAVRDGSDWQWPPITHTGPMTMLINGWSGSGGDAFPFFFKQQDLGPLIGTRTWGGLIGITGAPHLIDGGSVTVPTFRMYTLDGKWFQEGYGVEPDIKVVNDPTRMARGRDPQLERAIEWIETQLENRKKAPLQRPPYENRTIERK